MNWDTAREKLTCATQAVFGQKFYCNGQCFIGSFSDEFVESIASVESFVPIIDNVRDTDMQRIDFQRDDLITYGDEQYRFYRAEKHPRRAGLYRIILKR